jgi:hypothetical protein
MLLTGSLSDACRQQVIGIPFGMLRSIPGWPNLILARAHQAGARVFVTDVDTEDQLAAINNVPIDGIQTNRIEVIGPLVADLDRRRTCRRARSPPCYEHYERTRLRQNSRRNFRDARRGGLERAILGERGGALAGSQRADDSSRDPAW